MVSDKTARDDRRANAPTGTYGGYGPSQTGEPVRASGQAIEAESSEGVDGMMGNDGNNDNERQTGGNQQCSERCR